MVTLEEFEKAQKIPGRKGKPRITEKKDFLYKEIAICGKCGRTITTEAKKGGRYIYYHCTHKRPCNQKDSIEEKELPRQIDELFGKCTINEQSKIGR